MERGRTKRFFGSIKNYFWDIIFPIECLGCREEETWLCRACREKIKLNEKLICPICKKESPWGKVCPSCQGGSFFDGVIVAAPYEQELLQDLIHTYKYQFIPGLQEPLSELMITIIKSLIECKQERLGKIIDSGIGSFELNKFMEMPKVFLEPKKVIIIPVPLHRKRLKERGFNQAELLAQKLNSFLGARVEAKILFRQRYTRPQAELGALDRKENIKGAFVCVPGTNLNGQNIILLDDVFTTGATMQECARALKQAGAGEIYGLVLARG